MSFKKYLVAYYNMTFGVYFIQSEARKSEIWDKYQKYMQDCELQYV